MKVDNTDKIKEMCALGYTQGETASALGITRSAVSLCGKKYGIVFQKKPKVTHPIKEKRVTLVSQYRKCADDGMTLSETARKFGKTLLQVSGSCRNAGVVFHVKGKPFGRK